MRAFLRTTALTTALIGAEAGSFANIGPLRPFAGLIITLGSAAYGYAIRRWWCLAVLPIGAVGLARPCAYGDCQPDYSNGVLIGIVAIPVAMLFCGLGVKLGRARSRPTRA